MRTTSPFQAVPETQFLVVGKRKNRLKFPWGLFSLEVCPLTAHTRLWVPQGRNLTVHPGMPRVQQEMLSGCGVFAVGRRGNSNGVNSVPQRNEDVGS